jgi:hypothetical protein
MKSFLETCSEIVKIYPIYPADEEITGVSVRLRSVFGLAL